MKKQKILIKWTMEAFIEVDGDTVLDAINNFEKDKDNYIPTGGSYVKNSLEITHSPEEITEILRLMSSETPEDEPYLLEGTNLLYNPKFGDDRLCKCGHTYDRHFDFYEKDEHDQVVGCKYCNCYIFEEDKI